jgi:uncharacterized protein
VGMMDNKKQYLTEEVKIDLINRIRNQLKTDQRILFAFIHGSFLEADIGFSDIDVAVFIDHEHYTDDSLELCLTLSVEITSLVHNRVDVHSLNTSSAGFRYEVTKGELLFAKNEEVCFDFIEKTWLEYFDLKYIYENNLNDLLSV